MRPSATKLRSISPAPTSRMNDSATSVTTTPLRSRGRRAGRRTAARRAQHLHHVGARGAKRRHDAAQNRRGQSGERRRMSARPDRSRPRRAAADLSGRAPAAAARRRARAAGRARCRRRRSTRLSASICRTSRTRLAPIAARTASSRLRAEARTSSRLATLAHAISSTNATAPISDRIAGRTSPTRSSNIGTTRK